MLGSDEKEIVATLQRNHDQGIAFTVDILGEAVVSEKRGRPIRAALPRPDGGAGPRNGPLAGALPERPLAARPGSRAQPLGQTLRPLFPDPSCRPRYRPGWHLCARLRPILRRGQGTGRFHQLRHGELCPQEPHSAIVQDDFRRAGVCLRPGVRPGHAGIPEGLRGGSARDWSPGRASTERRITVRLVKGAYWDYETIIARQRDWPVAVSLRTRPESDASFEELPRACSRTTTP